MPSGYNYSNEQYDIIKELQPLQRYDSVTTRLLVLMYTIGYSRAKDELIGILCEYSGLSDKEKLEEAIDKCLEDGLLTQIKKPYVTICLQDEACRRKFASSLPIPLQKKLDDCRNQYLAIGRVTVEGILSGAERQGRINEEFRMLLKDAQREILLPMFNTSASPEVIGILEDRARAGVKIKILLADYDKVVSKYRRGKNSTIKEWTEPLGNIENIEIRVYSKLEYANIYSSVIVDNKICRICVFDVRRERSSAGTLIECKQSEGEDLNLIRLMIDRFDTIWRSSMPYNGNKVWHSIIEYKLWLIMICVISCGCYIFFDNQLAKECFIAIGTGAGGGFVTYIAPIIKKRVETVLNKLEKY